MSDYSEMYSIVQQWREHQVRRKAHRLILLPIVAVLGLLIGCSIGVFVVGLLDIGG